MLPQEIDLASRGDVARTFGEDFAGRVESLAPGSWEGPIESGYGLHLVLVRERVEGSLPSLAQVRQTVEREFQSDRRTRQLAAMYERLLAKYKVVIERKPEDQPGAGGAVKGDRDARRLSSLLLAAALAFGAVSPASAHETRPGFLELRESDPTTYSLLWKRPTGGEVEIQIAPVVPRAAASRHPTGSSSRRAPCWCAHADLRDGLAGKTLRIAGSRPRSPMCWCGSTTPTEGSRATCCARRHRR